MYILGVTPLDSVLEHQYQGCCSQCHYIKNMVYVEGTLYLMM